MTNASIYFHPDGYNTAGPRLMGRHAAGESFLRGFLRHAKVDRLHFFNASSLAIPPLEKLIQRIEPSPRPLSWVGRRERQKLIDPGCLYIPGPTLAPEAWTRRPFDARRYSICGVTHTTATHRVMDGIADLLTAPVEPWDALVCTSNAVRASIETQFDAVREDLVQRLGATRLSQPQLVTIPLGVNADDFAVDPAQRSAWRSRLDIPEDALVVLYIGRFSAEAKMNPATMALVLEAAAQATGKPIYWVVAGWAGSPEFTEKFHAWTREFCPSVHHRGVDGRPADTRFSIWSVADIFLSLSDNVQETFGLTPIEAMAAGLPCVVSDWDGYRDTVRHGVDGFRIPTYAPRIGLGRDLAFGYANDWFTYDQYLVAASQMTAVDINLASEAVIALVRDPDLRRRMGEAGRRQAREVFDWAVIVPQYQALWGELAARRKAASGPSGPVDLVDNPRRLDPFRLFAAYPTEPMTLQTVVCAVPGLTWPQAAARLDLHLASVGRWAMPTVEETEHLFEQIRGLGEATVAEIVARTEPPGRRLFVERAILWLAKYGLATIRAAKPFEG
jgi:glycosyltransferase involved in cell wall biosynthesis